MFAFVCDSKHFPYLDNMLMRSKGRRCWLHSDWMLAVYHFFALYITFLHRIPHFCIVYHFFALVMAPPSKIHHVSNFVVSVHFTHLLWDKWEYMVQRSFNEGIWWTKTFGSSSCLGKYTWKHIVIYMAEHNFDEK